VVRAGDDVAPAPPVPRPRRTISIQLQFEFDSARLTESALASLSAVGSALQAPELRNDKFLVSGHTDAAGRYDYNKQLSMRRADAVRTYLMVRHGIEAERIVAVGKASDELIDPADPRSAANRRVQFEALD
jgi:outer membrane protein OmpA-like peptidoglycan-associated protein